MIIAGIDPGVATTGFGIIEKNGKDLKCIDYGIISTDKKIAHGKRLAILEKGIARVIKQFKPEVMVVEKLFFFKNLKTAMPVSEARGVILLTATKKNIQIEEYTPLQVKMTICGYGRAEKKQVQRMVQEILKLKEIPRPDDAADALAIAISYAVENKVLRG